MFVKICLNCEKSVFRGISMNIMSSIVGNGRRQRNLPLASVAIKMQYSSEKHILKTQNETRYGIIWTFLLIVLGGTLLTVATIQHSEIIYGLGLIVLALSIVYICFQSSRLNNPCSLQ